MASEIKACFDTNVVLDIVLKGRGYPESLTAFDIASIRSFKSYIPASSVTDIARLLHKNGVPHDQVRETLADLFGMFAI